MAAPNRAITLVPLSRDPALGRAPLQWSIDLWGQSNPWFSSEDWQSFYRNAAQADYHHWDLSGIDQEHIYIALVEGEVVGAIALVDFDDVEEFRSLKPWVAAFVVDPSLRSQGLGSAMLEALEEKARTFGIDELYLWTEDKSNFYSKRGYQEYAHRDYTEISIDIMLKRL